MHFLQRSLGIFPFSLGAVGIIACGLLAMGAWFAGERIEQMNQRLFSQSDRLFTVADRQMQRASQGLEEAQEVLSIAELGLEKDFDEEMVRNFLAKPEVKLIEQRLQSSISEVESLIQVIDTCDELIRQAEESLRFSFQRAPSIEGTFRESLGKSRVALLRLLRVVSDAQACWYSLNQGNNIEINAKNLLRMNAQIKQQLAEVRDSVMKMRERLMVERETWQKFGKQANRYIALGQYCALAILLWIGLGQYALCHCGLQRFQAK
jgi:hypothetical protein